MISDRKIKNTLIISPPGCGKTTYLRDISRKLCELSDVINVLIIDERFEIASQYGGARLLNVGKYVDVLSGCDKTYGFREGVRTLRPDVIITDELVSEDDVKACNNAIMSGITVVASAHAQDINDLKNKAIFKELFSSGCFDRYIVLSANNGPGTVECVYNESFEYLYMR
jgi:stage III sporulation protein AA